jgi:hypothetical protein
VLRVIGFVVVGFGIFKLRFGFLAKTRLIWILLFEVRRFHEMRGTLIEIKLARLESVAMIRSLFAAVKHFAKNIAKLQNRGLVMFYSNTAARKTGDFGNRASITESAFFVKFSLLLFIYGKSEQSITR